jgi:uncharacterized protein YjbI with pentapeptide repeats
MTAGGRGMSDETAPGDEPPAEVQSDEHVKAFFLDLAAKGKDAWNEWRRDRANEDVHVTFAGIDFSKAPLDGIDFSGFEFGDHADFSFCKWRGLEGSESEDFEPGRACFTGAAFGDSANFAGAAFGDEAAFTRAAFGDEPDFTRAAFGVGNIFHDVTFGDEARFTGAVFGKWTFFTNLAFGKGASFACTTFSHGASFVDTVFGHGADFTGAAFGEQTMFKRAHFMGDVEFTGWTVEQWTRYLALALDLDEGVPLALEKRHTESWTRHGSGPDRFLGILCWRARFDGEANFSGRTFEQVADFTQVRFYYPPEFDPATKDARIDFTGAHIGFVPPGRLLHWISDAKVPLRLRALRKIAEETKNHDLERDLYIAERKAERGVYWHQRWEALKKEGWKNWPRNSARLIAHILWIIVMGVYWALADYGRSIARPFGCWLVLSLIIFPWLYSLILPVPLRESLLDAYKYEQAVQLVARANAVPFVGPLTIDTDIKKFLFCVDDKESPPIPPEGFQLLVIL